MFGIPNVPKISVNSIAVGVLGSIEGMAWDWLEEKLTWEIRSLDDGIEDLFSIDVDSVLQSSYSSSSEVPTFPITEGSFVSYNKVRTPDVINLSLVKTGTPQERSVFIEWLKRNREQPTLFNIISPEVVFESLTLKEFSISRGASDGTATMIIADCVFEEVREIPAKYYDSTTGKANTTNAENPADTPTKQSGYRSPVGKLADSVTSAIDSATEELQALQAQVTDLIGKYL